MVSVILVEVSVVELVVVAAVVVGITATFTHTGVNVDFVAIVVTVDTIMV